MRNSALLVSVVAIGCIVVGARMTSGSPWQTVLTVGGIGVAFFSVPLVVIRHVQTFPLKRLQAGTGVIARWTVPPAQWERFKAMSGEWDRTPGRGKNAIDLSQPVPPAGIDVVMGSTSFLVGDDYHEAGTLTSRVRDGWLETQNWEQPDETAGWFVYYRWPFPPEVEKKIREVFRH
jgi:hypothetical protein